MKIFNLFFYLLSLLLINIAIYLIDIKFEYSILINKPVLILIISGFIMSLSNFSFTEVRQALRDILNSRDYHLLKKSGLILENISKNTLISILISIVAANISLYCNPDLYTIADYFTYNAIPALYFVFLKLFVFIPLETSLNRKLIYIKKFKTVKKKN